MNSSTSTVTWPQALFESEMARAYCPNSPLSTQQWDPVLRTWRLSNAVPLFPPQHASKADAIFGEGAANEIYSAHNGLFLHDKVEHALNKGYIAIVPDGQRDGQRDGLPNYKVVILDKQRQEVHKRIGRFEVDGFERCMDLDERQLHFKTAFRPKLRYVWWRYVSAVLQTFYWGNSPSCSGNLDRHSAVRWLDSFWRYHGLFVKRSQVMWFLAFRPGPNWTAAFDRGFEEEGDAPRIRPELEDIFRNEQRERQHSPEPDYEEVESDEGTQERGHNGELLSGNDNPVASLAPGLANLQLRGDPNPSPASIYPSRAFIPAPPPYPYTSNPPPAFPSAPPPSYPSGPPPSYYSPYPPSPPPPPPPISAGRGQHESPVRLMLTWRGNSTTGNGARTTRTMRTIRTARTSGAEYTGRTEVTETVSTVSGHDEPEEGEDGEQASEEDDTSAPRFRSGELVASKVFNLTRFHLDPRTPKPGDEQVHLSTELTRYSESFHDWAIPVHSRVWVGSTSDYDGNTWKMTVTDITMLTRRDGNTSWNRVEEWTSTTVKVKTGTVGENGEDNHIVTEYEEGINTMVVMTNDNNGQ